MALFWVISHGMTLIVFHERTLTSKGFPLCGDIPDKYEPTLAFPTLLHLSDKSYTPTDHDII